MPNTAATRDPLPDESASLEEIAEFWDTHDTTDYPDAFVTVDATFDIRRRHYEVEIREDIYKVASQRSAAMNIPLHQLVDDVLRRSLIPAG